MDRIDRLGVCLVAFAFVFVGGVVYEPSEAASRVGQLPVAPTPSAASSQPVPSPLVTIAPLGQESPLPYPAYGTPVPGVNAGVESANVPQQITLQQAIAIGFARSPALASRANVAVQAAAVRLTLSGLLPSLEGSASTTYSYAQGGIEVETNPLSQVSTSYFVSGTITTNVLSASLRQLIFDGGKTALAVRSAQRTQASLTDTYLRDLQTVAYDVATAYYTYLAAERTTQVDLQMVKNNQVQEDLVRAQVTAGTTPPVDIATAELPVAQARVAVVKAQGLELPAQAAFSKAMGLDANIHVQPIDDTQR
jgi:outer membrane protein